MNTSQTEFIDFNDDAGGGSTTGDVDGEEELIDDDDHHGDLDNDDDIEYVNDSETAEYLVDFIEANEEKLKTPPAPTSQSRQKRKISSATDSSSSETLLKQIKIEPIVNVASRRSVVVITAAADPLTSRIVSGDSPHRYERPSPNKVVSKIVQIPALSLQRSNDGPQTEKRRLNKLRLDLFSGFSRLSHGQYKLSSRRKPSVNDESDDDELPLASAAQINIIDGKSADGNGFVITDSMMLKTNENCFD